jgi:gliding motility-associated-like protein
LQYDIWRGAPIDGGFPSAPWETTSANELFFTDREASRARLCYRIFAINDGSGCADFSSSNETCVNFPPTLFVPTAFTPNGDGLNDYFSSFGEFVEFFQMDVYDRWGKLLFRSNDVHVGWDGTENGVVTPEGVYVYKVEVRGYEGTVMKKEGSVTLIR